MNDYRVDPAKVTTNFGGTCPWAGAKGDACAAVAVRWNSTNTTTKVTATTIGIDHVSAAFSTAENRWWLCSSYFQPTTSLGHAFYVR
jgi:phosphatidylserine/phosphatidylglycerophosphate/cardiolipin synthase-like enzyme